MEHKELFVVKSLFSLRPFLKSKNHFIDDCCILTVRTWARELCRDGVCNINPVLYEALSIIDTDCGNYIYPVDYSGKTLLTDSEKQMNDLYNI